MTLVVCMLRLVYEWRTRSWVRLQGGRYYKYNYSTAKVYTNDYLLVFGGDDKS